MFSTKTLANAVAQVLGLSPMARPDVIKFLRHGAGITEVEANEVIVYALDHSLLVEDPADATQLQGAPRLSQQP